MSVSSRLPKNFRMETTGLKTPIVRMSFTLETLDHVTALREVLNKAVIPILKLEDSAATSLRQGQ